MPGKADRDGGAAGEAASPSHLAADLAEREARWRRALAEAEDALAGGEAQDAERRAKALSAVAKAAMELEAWHEQAKAALRSGETARDGEAFRRELEIRINRARREEGLEPLFDEDPDPV
jgi:hypothetical protein